MKIKQIINPDNNMWRSADPPQRYQGTLKHEIGHLFGLYDRYQRKNGEYATPIAKDLMSVDIPRNNAVEPFKRIWRSAGLEQSGSKAVIINKKNRELKN